MSSGAIAKKPTAAWAGFAGCAFQLRTEKLRRHKPHRGARQRPIVQRHGKWHLARPDRILLPLLDRRLESRRRSSSVVAIRIVARFATTVNSGDFDHSAFDNSPSPLRSNSLMAAWVAFAGFTAWRANAAGLADCSPRCKSMRSQFVAGCYSHITRGPRLVDHRVRLNDVKNRRQPWPSRRLPSCSCNVGEISNEMAMDRSIAHRHLKYARMCAAETVPQLQARLIWVGGALSSAFRQRSRSSPVHAL